MHEYPITQEIIKIAETHCRNAGGQRVLRINLVLGEASGYVGDSIGMYFDIISDGSLCHGAHISIETIPPKLRCAACGHLFQKEPFSFDCPRCGGQGEPSDIGREFYIDSIEIE